MRSCPGANSFDECDPTLRLDSPAGTAVYSTTAGKVVAARGDFVQIASRREAAVIYYDGVTPTIEEGQYVGRGQKIAESNGRVAFGVQQFRPGGEIVNVDPSSWLAARGQRIAADYTGSGAVWCEKVRDREVVVPRPAGSACNLHEPDKGRFALLPVSVEVQR